MTGEELRRVRELLRMTQGQLAEAIGMHANSVARMERGELAISPRTERVVRLLVSK